MSTAKLIRRARKAKGLTPAALAARLDVSRSTVHAWEHDGPGPSLPNLRAIAAELGVEVHELLS